MRSSIISSAILILVATIFTSCSGSGNGSILPDLESLVDAQIRPSNTVLWGFYNISIDSELLSADIIPARTQMFSVNVVNFLNQSPGNLGVKINSIDTLPEYTDIDVDVTLKHPFSGMNQYDGYDVRGIFIGNGSGAMQYNGDLIYPIDETDQILLNADGYSRWWNPTEFTTPNLFGYVEGNAATKGYSATATLNPYKYFADGLGKNQNLWDFLNTNSETHHGKFSSGVSNTRNYFIRFPSPNPGIKFKYAVIACWESPTTHPSNADETVGIDVAITPDLYYVDSSNYGGNLVLDLSIFGWKNQPTGIYVESPIFTTVKYIDPSSAVTGGDSFVSTYHIDIPADIITSNSDAEFFVICEYDDLDYSNDFGVPNSAGNDPLAAIFRYKVEISDTSPCLAPVPSAINPASGFNNESKICTVTTSNLWGTTGIAAYLDKSGVIDGTYDISGTNISNINVGAGTFNATFNLNGASPGYYYVIVTNSCGETGRSESKLFNVKEYVVGNIYVSNHQDFDSVSQNGTMTNPYHTIAQGITAAGMNHVILVDYGRGTYPEEIYVSKNNFTLRAYNWYSDSGRPLIGGPTCTTSAQAAVLTFTYNYNITIQGFKIAFTGGTSYSNCRQVFLTGAYNMVFKDVFFTGDASQQYTHIAYVIDGTYCHDITFTNCLFKDLNGGTHPSAYDSFDIRGVSGLFAYNMTIEKCEFTKFQSKPVNPVGTYGIYIFPIIFQQDSGNFTIKNNLFHHIKPTFTDNAGHSISNFVAFSAYYTGAPGTNGVIKNNTIDNMSAASNSAHYGSNVIAIRNANSNPAVQYADIHSNIISDFLGTTNHSLYGVQDINKTDYTNIWHALRGTVEYPWFDASHEGTGCIYSDPKYVNNTTEPYDYHLAAGSPCIGTGKAGVDMGCYGGLNEDEVIGLLGPE